MVAENRTFTVGIERTDVFLFCQESDNTIPISNLKWRSDTGEIYSNPLNVNGNIQNTSNYNLWEYSEWQHSNEFGNICTRLFQLGNVGIYWNFNQNETDIA